MPSCPADTCMKGQPLALNMSPSRAAALQQSQCKLSQHAVKISYTTAGRPQTAALIRALSGPSPSPRNIRYNVTANPVFTVASCLLL